MDAESLKTPEEQLRKLEALIQEVKSFMMTTVDSQGKLCSRPMVQPRQNFQGELWFFTSRHSGKVHEIEEDQEVNLSSSSMEQDRHLSLSGRATVIDNKEKSQELWNPLLKAWFPDGVDDPALTLIRVTVDKAEYWESHQTAMGRVYNITKAVLTGRPYRVEPEEHRKINIQH